MGCFETTGAVGLNIRGHGLGLWKKILLGWARFKECTKNGNWEEEIKLDFGWMNGWRVVA